MVSSVSYEALRELMQCDSDAGLEPDVQECVFGDVVMVCCFLLGVGGVRVRQTRAVEVVVVVGYGTAAACVSHLGSLRFDVFAIDGGGRWTSSMPAEGPHAS
mgnify:CR=1 FL=1